MLVSVVFWLVSPPDALMKGGNNVRHADIQQTTARLASEVASQALLRNRTRSLSENQKPPEAPHRHSVASMGSNNSSNDSLQALKPPKKTPIFIRKLSQRTRKEPKKRARQLEEPTEEETQFLRTKEQLRKELLLSVGKTQIEEKVIAIEGTMTNRRHFRSAFVY